MQSRTFPLADRIMSVVLGTMVICFALLLSTVALAQLDEDDLDAEPQPRPPVSLPQAAATDTVRTNVWLTEALMGEIVARATRVIPAAPGAIRLVKNGNSDADDMLQEAMTRVLGGQGYELYLPGPEESRQAAVDHIVQFHVVGVDLAYPDVGRTLGIWRQWIARELTVTAQVEITAADSGRLLFSDRLARTYTDRVADGEFDRVDSDLYGFTTAETAEGGWQSRMEEIVVLGTLAGLVAVYFANTTD
nr:hypothetical protein [Candidatus Krumholzibacteria bacterium]